MSWTIHITRLEFHWFLWCILMLAVVAILMHVANDRTGDTHNRHGDPIPVRKRRS